MGSTTTAASYGTSNGTPTIPTLSEKTDDTDSGNCVGGDDFSGCSGFNKPSFDEPSLAKVTVTSSLLRGTFLENEAQLPLRDASDVDNLIAHVTTYSLLIWLGMLAAVYGMTDEWHYLERDEQQAATLAATCLGISTLMLLVPHVAQRRSFSSIVVAAIVIQIIAFFTNVLLAWMPVPVATDPFTQVPVYLLRWVEWTPLAGFMTFLTEAVALRQHSDGLKWPLLLSCAQTLSVVCGLLLPFCPNTAAWCLCMILSFLTFSTMFPRCFCKYRMLKRTERGSTFSSMEYFDRLQFAFRLLLACTVVWSVLVLLYFFNMIVYQFVDETHWYRQKPVIMIADTVFDVLAKGLYMKLIVDVHAAVFDRHQRAHRQLNELRCLMGVLWESSSDAICMSVPHHSDGNKITSMLSPSFLELVGATLPLNLASKQSVAMMLETQHSGRRLKGGYQLPEILSAYYVDRYVSYCAAFSHIIFFSPTHHRPIQYFYCC